MELIHLHRGVLFHPFTAALMQIPVTALCFLSQWRTAQGLWTKNKKPATKKLQALVKRKNS